MENQNNKVHFWYSMRMKILRVVAIGVITTCVAILAIVIPFVRMNMKSMTKSSMADITEAYARNVEEHYRENSNMDYEDYKELLNGAGMSQAESSYVYVVDSAGNLLYHPTQDKVGQPVENEVVKGLVADLAAGKDVKSAGIAEYKFDGAKKYAAYEILSNQNIIVLSADEEEVFSELHSIMLLAIAAGVIVFAVVLVIACFYSAFMVKPLRQITNLINEMKDFRFLHHAENDKLVARKDECGAMAKAVREMRTKLKGVIREIDEVSERLFETVEQLKVTSDEINTSCTDNSATTQQLAAGMQETTATTQSINANIGDMQNESGEIQNLSKDGEKLSYEIETRADQLRTTTGQSVHMATDMFEQVKAETQKAIEDAQAVDKINELTGVIMEISSQTSLLALNASIEAARAGEAGRGFAVVASEIGALANQTSQTVENINSIVEEVNRVVNNMAASMNKTTEFMEKNVLPDYENFYQVSNQYASDAQTVKESMTMIQTSLTSLNGTIGTIAQGLDGINDTISESATGINDIAEKTTNVVTRTSDNEALVETCLADADGLKKLTEKFYIE